MGWQSQVSDAISRLVNNLKDDEANYYRQSDPMTAIPVNVIHSKMEKDENLGDYDSGTYQDSPHIFLKVADINFTPEDGDEIEVRGERISLYEIQLDGEGGLMAKLGTYRG